MDERPGGEPSGRPLPGPATAPAEQPPRAAGVDPEDWAGGNRSDQDDLLIRERPPHWG